jgi:hypothetical protein
MKLKKLTSIILTAAMLLLCSCGSAETVSDVEILLETSQTEISETASQATVSQTSPIPETIAASETTQTPAEEITFEDAAENAKLVYEKAKELFAQTLEYDRPYTHFLYVGSLGQNIEKMPTFPEVVNGVYVENALNYLTDVEPGGIYAISLDMDGSVNTVAWSPSFNSTVIGYFPQRIINEDNENTLSDILLRLYSVKSTYLPNSATQSANARAKLVFQNAATYVTLVQIYGASFDKLEYSGSLGEKNDERPRVDEGEALTGDDFTNALRYYMGGPDGGVYTILLDEHYNPIGALWAADEESSVVGAYPKLRLKEENESGNINTADIYKAAGLD